MEARASELSSARAASTCHEPRCQNSADLMSTTVPSSRKSRARAMPRGSGRLRSAATACKAFADALEPSLPSARVTALRSDTGLTHSSEPRGSSAACTDHRTRGDCHALNSHTLRSVWANSLALEQVRPSHRELKCARVRSHNTSTGEVRKAASMSRMRATAIRCTLLYGSCFVIV